MYCSRCGTEGVEGANFCHNCGKALGAASKDSASAANTAKAVIQERYKAAIGPKNTDYYLSHFQRFDNNERAATWNWSAFFLAFPWLLYRKMWCWAIAYCLLPLTILLFNTVVSGSAKVAAGPISILCLLAAVFGLPMYANALYHQRIKKQILEVKAIPGDEQTRLQWLARQGGTNNIGRILLRVVLPLLLIVVLAAVVVPVYQAYSVRSKLSEALEAVALAKAGITSYVAEHGRYPADFGELNIGLGARPDSDIIASVTIDDVTDGTVKVVANVMSCIWEGEPCSELNVKSFHLAGSINSDGSMSWVCLPGDTYGQNAIKIGYLPADCRGQ